LKHRNFATPPMTCKVMPRELANANVSTWIEWHMRESIEQSPSSPPGPPTNSAA